MGVAQGVVVCRVWLRRSSQAEAVATALRFCAVLSSPNDPKAPPLPSGSLMLMALVSSGRPCNKAWDIYTHGARRGRCACCAASGRRVVRCPLPCSGAFHGPTEVPIGYSHTQIPFSSFQKIIARDRRQHRVKPDCEGAAEGCSPVHASRAYGGPLKHLLGDRTAAAAAVAPGRAAAAVPRTSPHRCTRSRRRAPRPAARPTPPPVRYAALWPRLAAIL
jgi:hypothetical protein